MNDPTRLLLESDSDLERSLLRAGRARPPLGARQRAWLVAAGAMGASGVAAGSAAAGTSATGSAAASTSATVVKAGSLATIKMAGLFGVVSIGAVTGIVAVRTVQRAQSAEQTASTATAAPAKSGGARRLPWVANPVAQVVQPSSSAVPNTVLSTPPSESTHSTDKPRAVAIDSARPSAGSTDNTSALAGELARLDQAHQAIAAGDPAGALEILDAYGQAFPHGSLAPEATVLRVEALIRAGDRPAAERAASALLARSPDSPYARRIESLLASPNP